jgi:hypothetical protein
MGKSWGGGKGDESRVSNHKAYWESPLWHKKKGPLFVSDEVGFIDPVDDEPKSSRYKPHYLFLDDDRVPQNAFCWDENMSLWDMSGIKHGEWSIVRSYNQFVEYIEKNGIPDVVSFDNDLFDVRNPKVSDEELKDQFMMKDWENFSIKTGAHCAQYLVAQCAAQNKPVPKYYVHSANNIGRKVIRKILEDAIQDKI